MRLLRPVVILTLALSASFSALGKQSSTDDTDAPLIHLNVAAAGFSPETLPGKEGTNYVFPDSTYLDKWQAGGIEVIRFSIIWERLQPTPKGIFDVPYARGIDKFLTQAAARKMRVIIDIHNYGRYYNKIIGSKDVPTPVYADLMKRVAKRWGDHPGMYGYDLMNEPYGEADVRWKNTAQAGINAVRIYDTKHPIYVEGRAWSNTAIFPDLNADLLTLEDPSDNLVYSAHLYLDEGSSGQYAAKMTSSNWDTMTGVNRAKPFVEWLIRNNKRGQFGEFGVPGNDPKWLAGMDNLLSYLHENCIPLAYWAAGPWWAEYPLSVEPKNGVMPPQWTVLSKWIKTPNKCTAPQS
jgi:endoglucanase